MADEAVAANAAPRQCRVCNMVKPAMDYYASERGRCKECVKSRVRSNRAQNLDHYQAYDRKRYRENEHRKEAARKSSLSEAGQRSRAASARRIKAENPEKSRARNAVNNAIRDGRIERGTNCFFCASTGRLHAHHEDYDHPLDVVWLCPSCHGKLHTIKGDFRRPAA